jgi:hypothetical protein
MNIQLLRFALAVLLPAIILCTFEEAAAQSRSITGRQKAIRRIKPKTPRTPVADTTAKPAPSPQALTPVSVVNLAEPDYLSGETSVTVNPKQPTVIRLGLAQNAVSIIEFPASDGIYYIHEGNPKLASVFQSPTKESDRFITVYPGESFLPVRDGNTATAVSLQMRSGLVLILEFVPVSDLRKNAHRCVITYDRDAVIAARKAAGLAYDLGGENLPGVPFNSKAVSKLVGPPKPTESTNSIEKPSSDTSQWSSSASAVVSGTKNPREKRGAILKTEAEISSISNKRLAETLREPKKNLGGWSKAQQGLELAVSRIAELDPENRLIVVAVRNTTASNLRLVPGSPELQIQTADAEGHSIQTARLDIRYIESTTLEGLVQPGSAVYYALVYKAPILGTNQSVRVLVAHREAADAPIIANLGESKTKE